MTDIDISYHASHEQFAPSTLLGYALLAESNGFTSLHSSDHFHPWSKRQGQSGFAFSWLGAAMQATRFPCGMVCAPGQRYHPAIVAQAIATFAEMFPGRFWISLGSGEALNENITGDKWPSKAERNERLQECVTIIRRLLNGETVDHHGRVKVENARLYTLPAEQPLILCAAQSTATAAWAAKWADGLITTSRPHHELKQLIETFRENGGANKPVFLKVQLSYARNSMEALHGAYDQWRTNIFHGHVLGEMRSVAEFDAVGELVKPEQITGHVRISADPDEHIDWIREDLKLGFNKIILHNVNRLQEDFIQDFGRMVLPEIRKS